MRLRIPGSAVAVLGWVAMWAGTALAALPVSAHAEERLRLATTTSTDNSGLLGAILPPFEAANHVKVDVIAVGTGKALKLGENGDVDVVLVHARPAEDKFVAAGFGVDRRDVMHNDFVLVGPADDPAGIGHAKDAADALARIMDFGKQGKAAFVSRGDDSGTHKKERALWAAAGRTPEGPWYLEAGQGMGQVLMMATEKGAYTLADRGTWIAYRGRIRMPVLFEGDPALFNPYGVIAVNPKRHPEARYDLATKFIAYLTGAGGQRRIAAFQVDGKQLFYPDAALPGGP